MLFVQERQTQIVSNVLDLYQLQSIGKVRQNVCIQKIQETLSNTWY